MRLSKWMMFVGAILGVAMINAATMMLFVRHVSAEQQRVIVVTAPATSPLPTPSRPYDDSLWALPSPEPHPVERILPPPPIKRTANPPPLQRKQFYLVASPESNGNRFLVKLLLSAGCYGHAGHQQPFDESARSSGPPWPNGIRDPRMWPSGHANAPCAVMHRSVPHAKVWPNIGALVRRIEEIGYEPRILVSWRPEDVARASQVAQKHVKTASEAEDHILHAQRHIIRAVAELDTTWVRFVLYEQLGHAHYLDWLFREQMGLTLPPNHPTFEDRDSKHFHAPK